MSAGLAIFDTMNFIKPDVSTLCTGIAASMGAFLLDFAMKVCERSHEICEADFEALYPHGFDDEDIWDIAAITSFFGLSNRLASFAGMQPNPEFYLLGRVPRPQRGTV